MKLFLASSIALVGCAGAATDVSTTETTSALLSPVHVVATEPAIRDISRAQCARAQACGAVTSRGIYRDADYCETDVRREARDDLIAPTCVNVDASRLSTCIDAIRHEDCGSMSFTEAPPIACTRVRLCR